MHIPDAQNPELLRTDEYATPNFSLNRQLVLARLRRLNPFNRIRQLPPPGRKTGCALGAVAIGLVTLLCAETSCNSIQHLLSRNDEDTPTPTLVSLPPSNPSYTIPTDTPEVPTEVPSPTPTETPLPTTVTLTPTEVEIPSPSPTEGEPTPVSTPTQVPSAVFTYTGTYCTDTTNFEIPPAALETTFYTCDSNGSLEVSNNLQLEASPTGTVVFLNPDAGDFNGQTSTITATATTSFSEAVDLEQSVATYAGVSLLDSQDGSSQYGLVVDMNGVWQLLHMQNGKNTLLATGMVGINQQSIDLTLSYHQGVLTGSIDQATVVIGQGANNIYAYAGMIVNQNDGSTGTALFTNFRYQQG